MTNNYLKEDCQDKDTNWQNLLKDEQESLINLFVYLGFISVVLLGSQIKSIKFGNILLASFLFFLISNFGVWILGYPKNLEGLLLCYTMAIPFFGYSIAGDLFFGYLFKFSFRKISSILPKSAN